VSSCLISHVKKELVSNVSETFLPLPLGVDVVSDTAMCCLSWDLMSCPSTYHSPHTKSFITLLITQESFIAYSHHESFKSDFIMLYHTVQGAQGGMLLSKHST
jgi:hypothetical protein